MGVTVNDGKVFYRHPLQNKAFAFADLCNCDFTVDGKRLLAAAGEGLLLLDADGSNQKKIADSPLTYPKFSPDATKIALLRNGHLFQMNADGSNLQPLAPDITVEGYIFSPDSTALVVRGRVAQPAPKPATVSPAPEQQTHAAPTQAEIDAAKKAGTQTVLINTERGLITVDLYGKDAPLTVANFVKLVKSHFYDGLTFHRVVPGFVIQGGDPAGNGSGGPGYAIKLEIAPSLTHVDGALAMARTNEPDSAGSQFYITLGAQHELDGQYAVFGKVVQGLDVVKKIQLGDKIVSIKMK